MREFSSKTKTKKKGKMTKKTMQENTKRGGRERERGGEERRTGDEVGVGLLEVLIQPPVVATPRVRVGVADQPCAVRVRQTA